MMIWKLPYILDISNWNFEYSSLMSLAQNYQTNELNEVYKNTLVQPTKICIYKIYKKT